jgi:hypothetical protein
VLLESLACMMCLFCSIIIKNSGDLEDKQDIFIYTLLGNATFWIAFMLTAVVFAVPILMAVFH